MAAIRTGLIAAALTVGMLTGCTAATPSQPPPRPSPTCTPEAGGPGTPCTQYQYDQMIAKDKLYAEAEAVYRKYAAEDERVYRAGGITTPSPVLLETTTGDYLAASMEVYRELRKYQATAVGGEFKLVWVQRVPGLSMKGSIVTLLACRDTSSVSMGVKGAKPSPGALAADTVYLVRDGGKLKLAAFRSQEVKQC